MLNDDNYKLEAEAAADTVTVAAAETVKVAADGSETETETENVIWDDNNIENESDDENDTDNDKDTVTVNTVLGDDIEATDGAASYDGSAKKLVANNAVLSVILSMAVDELNKYPPAKIQDFLGKISVSRSALHRDVLDADERVAGSNTEDVSVKEHNVTFDIRFEVNLPWGEGGKADKKRKKRRIRKGKKTKVKNKCIEIIINIEVQRTPNETGPLECRVIYHLGRLVSAQYGTVFKDREFNKLEKVYSIWIVPDPAKYRRNSIYKIALGGKNILGDYHGKPENVDKMTGLIINLSGDKDTSDNRLLRLLDVLLSDTRKPEEKRRILEGEYGIPYTKEINTEVENMCNLSQGLIEKGRIQGHKQGRAQGRKEGRKQGRAQGRKEGREQGRAQGRIEGQEELLVRQICTKLRKNKDIKTIAKELEVEESRIRNICEIAEEFHPGYDEEKVLEKLREKKEAA